MIYSKLVIFLSNFIGFDKNTIKKDIPFLENIFVLNSFNQGILYHLSY
jgi:hypothetical protein